MNNEKLITLFRVILAASIIAAGVSGIFIADHLSDDGRSKVTVHEAFAGGDAVDGGSSEFRKMYPWYLFDDTAEKLSPADRSYGAGIYGLAVCQSFLCGKLNGIDIENARVYLCHDMLFVFDCPINRESGDDITVSFVLDSKERLTAFEFSGEIAEKNAENGESRDYENAGDIYISLADKLNETEACYSEDYRLWMDEMFAQFVGKFNNETDFMAEYCNYLFCVGGSSSDAYILAELLSENAQKSFRAGEDIFTVYGYGDSELCILKDGNSGAARGMSVIWDDSQTVYEETIKE